MPAGKYFRWLPCSSSALTTAVVGVPVLDLATFTGRYPVVTGQFSPQRQNTRAHTQRRSEANSGRSGSTGSTLTFTTCCRPHMLDLLLLLLPLLLLFYTCWRRWCWRF